MMQSETELLNNSQELQDSEPPAKKAKNLWTIFKPVVHTRLLYHICNTNSISAAIHSWLDTYNINQEKGIEQIIQLSVDLASYQNCNISAYLSYHNYKEIISHIEKDISPILKETGKYFLKISSPKFQICIEKISSFFIGLIEESNENRTLYDLEYFKQILIVWKNMSENKLRAIRHTGVFLAITFNTGLVTILSKKVQTLTDISKTLEYETNEQFMQKLQEQKSILHDDYETLNMFSEFITKKIFMNNYNLEDPELSSMKAHCIDQLKNWMLLFPARYFTNHYLDILINATNDLNKQVRFKSLSALLDLMKYPDFKQTFVKQIKKIGTVVLDRLFDIDIKTSVLAVKILFYIDENLKSLSSSIKSKIFIKVYCFHAVLAVGCGKYLTKYIRLSAENDLVLILKVLHYHIETQKQFDIVSGKIPLLVEALIDHIPELRKIELYVNLFDELIKKKCNEESIDILLDMLGEVLQIICFGTYSFKRTGSLRRKVNLKEADEMVEKLIKSLTPLSKLLGTKIKPFLIFIVKFKLNPKAIEAKQFKKRQTI